MEERFEELLKFSEDFRVAKEKEEEKLPYHINVIDELHINENAHSRVLTKLLQYKNEKKEYLILQSLLNYIVNSKKMATFNQISIKEPTITQEIARIDLWVRDENYAIIFENKIYNAADQDAQICRYIERTKEKKYQEGQIFVIYLSRDGKEPDEQSWGSYKESFKSRYVNLSFRYDILPWLKNDVIPNVRQKDVYLLSALQQYVFFLEGDKMFRTDGIYKNMNMELNKMIEEKFGPDMVSLIKKQEEIRKVLEQMELYKNSFFEELYQTWKNDTAIKFKDFHPNENTKKYWPITQVKIENFKNIGDVYISISGGHTDPDSSFYIGIIPLSPDKWEDIKNYINKYAEALDAENTDKRSKHKCIDLTEYDKVFPFFEELVKWSIKKDDSNFTYQP